MGKAKNIDVIDGLTSSISKTCNKESFNSSNHFRVHILELSIGNFDQSTLDGSQLINSKRM